MSIESSAMGEMLNNSAIIKKFNDFLEAGHYRKTPERFAILDRVLTFPRAFTIDDLALKLEADAYHVSRATVYNSVELLLKAGVLRRFHLDGMSMQYVRVNSTQCTHLICTVCGKVKNVKDPKLAAFMNARKYNAFTTSHYSLCVYGLCNACARKLKKSGRKKSQLNSKK